MEKFYYNLSGGINNSSTKVELGMNTNNIYWHDAENVEILQNKGIKRQNGNRKIFELEDKEKITAIHQMPYSKKILITTESGKIYIFDSTNQITIKLENKILKSKQPFFINFLKGVMVLGENDSPFYIKNETNYPIVETNLVDVKSNIGGLYKGRIWIANGSKLYFSALGKCYDFTSEDDAGYINDFYTDTNDITALKNYKDYLAIYKKNAVYILSGTNPNDFAITPFADKGAYSPASVINVNNRQYFLSQGIFPLQVGELNQIMLGDEITSNIKAEFEKFDKTRMSEALAIHYEKKNQVWYFIPYKNIPFFHTIWINDYVNKAWYKRVMPQNITGATNFEEDILTCDDNGKIYKEDIGNDFDGKNINFLWKSAFLSLGNPNVRKTIDEFYFLLDETYDNSFQFSVYKNYDSENKDDIELIYSTNFENLIWYKENSNINLNNCWTSDDDYSLWSVSADSFYKTEISEANYSIQLCVEGFSKENNCAIIGLEFKEVYKE